MERHLSDSERLTLCKKYKAQDRRKGDRRKAYLSYVPEDMERRKKDRRKY